MPQRSVSTHQGGFTIPHRRSPEGALRQAERTTEYLLEKYLVSLTAYRDRQRGEVTARDVAHLAYFSEGEVLHDPHFGGSLD